MIFLFFYWRPCFWQAKCKTSSFTQKLESLATTDLSGALGGGLDARARCALILSHLEWPSKSVNFASISSWSFKSSNIACCIDSRRVSVTLILYFTISILVFAYLFYLLSLLSCRWLSLLISLSSFSISDRCSSPALVSLSESACESPSMLVPPQLHRWTCPRLNFFPAFWHFIDP